MNEKISQPLTSTNHWIYNSIFYHIYPLGAFGAPRWNEGENSADSRITKFLDWIPHLKSMGINIVYFGPIFQSLSHGYDTSNYFQTDTRLGSLSDFKTVFDALHKNKIRVVVDAVFNHVGRGFWAFNDVQQKHEQSEYIDWFEGINFSEKSPAGDNFSYMTWEGNSDLVKLNLSNQDLCNHLISAVKMWISDLNIDGLRLDAADCIDKDFFELLHTETKSIKKDFWLLGEVIHGDYNEWANETMLDSTTDYQCWKAIYSSHNDINYFELAYAMNRQFGDEGIYRNLLLYNFLDNHDVDRISSLLKNELNLKNVYTILFTMPGIPSIYYGSEFGINGQKGAGYDADIPVRPEIDINSYLEQKLFLPKYIKKLAKLRLKNNSLRYGSYKELLLTKDKYVFARILNYTAVIVMLNASDKSRVFDFTFNDIKYHYDLKPHTSVLVNEINERLI